MQNIVHHPQWWRTHAVQGDKMQGWVIHPEIENEVSAIGCNVWMVPSLH